MALGKQLEVPSNPETAVCKLHEWLSDYGENPLYIIAKAGMFRTVFEVGLADSFDPEKWKQRADLLDGFHEQYPESETTRQWRQQHEFVAAQWRAQEQTWRRLVEDHLSDKALREYCDEVFTGWRTMPQDDA